MFFGKLGVSASQIIKSAAVGVVLVGLAACQTTQEALLEAGASKLAPEETAELYKDVTIAWLSGEGFGYYAPDGAYSYEQTDGKKGSGTWSVNEAGDMCLDVSEWYGDDGKCWEIWNDAGIIYAIGDAGKKYEVSSRIAAGNQLPS